MRTPGSGLADRGPADDALSLLNVVRGRLVGVRMSARDLAERVDAEDLTGAADAAGDLVRFAEGAVETMHRTTAKVTAAFVAAGVPFKPANVEPLRPGRRAPGKAAYGWRRAGRSIVACVREQEVLSRIDGLAAEGKGPTAVASRLNAEGYRKRNGKAWTASAVGKLMRLHARKKKAPAFDAKAETS